MQQIYVEIDLLSTVPLAQGAAIERTHMYMVKLSCEACESFDIQLKVTLETELKYLTSISREKVIHLGDVPAVGPPRAFARANVVQ